MEANIPHLNQSAYCKKVSCADVIFATQEIFARYARQGSHVFMCLYDLEKAFDTVEYPILLERLYAAGINGKCCRLIGTGISVYRSPVQSENSKRPNFTALCDRKRSQARLCPLSCYFPVSYGPTDFSSNFSSLKLGFLLATSLLAAFYMLMTSEHFLPASPLLKNRCQ